MIIVRNKIIPFKGFKALTVFPFIFVRSGVVLNIVDENHERIHGLQQFELLPFALLLMVVLLFAGCGWWSLLALPLYMWWYCVEYIVRLFKPGNPYRSISFEREAYSNQHDTRYIYERRWFAWVQYIKK